MLVKGLRLYWCQSHTVSLSISVKPSTKRRRRKSITLEGWMAFQTPWRAILIRGYKISTFQLFKFAKATCSHEWWVMAGGDTMTKWLIFGKIENFSKQIDRLKFFELLVRGHGKYSSFNIEIFRPSMFTELVQDLSFSNFKICLAVPRSSQYYLMVQ